MYHFRIETGDAVQPAKRHSATPQPAVRIPIELIPLQPISHIKMTHRARRYMQSHKPPVRTKPQIIGSIRKNAIDDIVGQPALPRDPDESARSFIQPAQPALCSDPQIPVRLPAVRT